MGSKTHKTVHNPDISPPSRKVCPRTVETSKRGGVGGNYGGGSGGGRSPGRGWQTESKGVTKEGGAREETGGARSRRHTAGPRPQP